MGTYRYYVRTNPIPGPAGMLARIAFFTTLAFFAGRMEYLEDIQEAGAMRDNTFLFYKYRTNTAKNDPNRPTFPKIPIE